MKVSCSFHLEPEQSGADQHTVATLKAWQQSLRKQHTEADSYKSAQGRFHKEIYQAGLYLRQISESLPGQLAQAFQGEQVQPQAMLHLLAANGVEAPSQGLSEPQWQQLKALMATSPEPKLDVSSLAEQLIPSLLEALSTPAEPSLDSDELVQKLAQQLGQGSNELSEAEVEALAAMLAPKLSTAIETPSLDIDQLSAQFGAQLIAQLESVSGNRQERGVAKQDLDEVLWGQSALQDEIRELRAQLSRQTKLIQQLQGGSVAAAAEEGDLAQKLASAQKVKSKGVW
ncbi:hypothetical protein [Ferrimonas marina]|uniref:Uncharacterized protein n=1 Tax=Ferrimonas marina TaxID=299255 RepID=A0A1M5YDR3_9GAMM|nr:hypothetical protein [Ferrimonas marina]SHI10175.1 hypothetical protein SAMN02745129_4127 [Ferrimonas marina]